MIPHRTSPLRFRSLPSNCFPEKLDTFGPSILDPTTQWLPPPPPQNLFKFATVRAPRKPLVADTTVRNVPYTLNSTLYQTLKTQRTGANARATMQATAITYKGTAAYVPTVSDLYAQFAGFQLVDDYLRTNQKEAVLADLKALVEGPGVLNKTAGAYIGAGTYGPLKSKVWDNLMVQCILGENTALRTEHTRILRLLNIIERIAANDPVLSTGAGIFGLYMATVLMPGDVFPLPDVPLPPEPTTNPVDTTAQDVAKERIADVTLAYEELKTLYEQQNYKYRRYKVDVKAQNTVPPPAITIYKHDPLVIDPETIGPTGTGISPKTKDVLGELKIDLDQVYMPYVHEQFQKELREQGKVAYADKGRQTVVRVGSSIVRVENECANLAEESPCSPLSMYVPWPGGAGHSRPLGIADLKVVQSQLYKYNLGEVAHIEDILKGEKKTRTFRNLDRTETTVVDESETTKESEQETQTTERFEMQKEASNVLQQDQQTSVSVTASYGFPAGGGVSLNAGTASSTSQLEADRLATDYAKDVMDRALTRVIERTRTEKTVTTIIEHEDTAEHSLDNTPTGAGGTDNVVGVYRWVDKIYYNKVVNYGRRLMFEFVVPEPAAFFVYSKLVKPATGEAMQVPPPFGIESFADIRVDNYDQLAIQFGATGIKPPPDLFKSVAITNNIEPPAGDPWHTWGASVDIPEGYQADNASVRILLSAGSNMYIHLWVGKQVCSTQEGIYQVELPMDQETGKLAIAARFHSNDFSVAIEVRCSPTAATFQQWQIDTYAALKTAYDQKLNDYNRWLNQQAYLAAQYGTNPDLNRQTERRELKKHCIEFISGQRFESFDALRTNTGSGYPEFSFTEATNEGKYIQFFEQAFEWEQISYYFYAYFWARKREWVNILKRDESDPLFMNFLQAGAARILVSVRPGYEKAMLHYLSTGGEIWNGEDVPAPNDPLYVSIIDEIKEADGSFEGGEDEGEPWLSKVPTSLVYLEHQGSPNDLPDYSADLPL